MGKERFRPTGIGLPRDEQAKVQQRMTGALTAGGRPAWEVTLSLRPEGKEDTQRVLVGIGWHKGPAVETSQAYLGGTQSRGKQALEREGGEADGAGHHGHLGMRARARDDCYSFFIFNFYLVFF